jgi:hypothetical protein
MTKDDLRALMPGGKNHQVAMDWLASDDAVLQLQTHGGSDWMDISNPLFLISDAYRIKPKTLRYRVALFQTRDKDYYIANTDDVRVCTAWGKHPEFIRFVTDWQEIEV